MGDCMALGYIGNRASVGKMIKLGLIAVYTMLYNSVEHISIRLMEMYK